MMTFSDGFDFSMLTAIMPFVLVALAVIWLMVAKMVRSSVNVAFGISTLLLVLAWFLGFSSTASPILGFSIDKLGELSLKLLLPAVIMVCFLIVRKDAVPSKKIEALLMVMISCLGAMITVVTTNWMLFFIGLQLLSLPIYGLLAFDPEDRPSLSSATRYLLLSFVAMAVMLFGILLLYAATGTMELGEQGMRFARIGTVAQGLMALGLVFVLIGIAFKVSLFPFHAWAPEVYRGAQLFVITYLVVIVKSVSVMFLMRIAFGYFGAHTQTLTSIITFMAIFSMWIGNGMMLREGNCIRLLAFLSIGHLGALMIPILAHNQLAVSAIFLDIFAFGVAMIVVFASLNVLGYSARGIRMDDIRGLYYRHPWSALTLALALISLSGFPMTVGFIGKFAIFQAGADAKLWHLMVHFVLSSLVGLAVIAYTVATIWLPPKEERALAQPIHRVPELLICATLTLVVMGMYPEPWIAWVKAYTTGVLMH